MKRAGLSALIASAVLISAPTANAATTYYATPSPMPGATCGPTDPCSISMAAGMASSGGDVVLLDPGTYPITADLSVFLGVTMAPRIAGTRPVISEPADVSTDVIGTLIGVEIDSTDPGSDRSLDVIGGAGAAAYRVKVVVDGTTGGGAAVQLRDGGLLSDSTVWAKHPSGTAIIAGGTGGTARNVTAIATGTNSIGFNAAGDFSSGVAQADSIHNSILRGTSIDLAADIGGPPPPPPATSVTVDIDHSNYVTSPPLPLPAGVTINDNGGNQSAAPLLASEAAGDFHELAGSPTIDAGAVVGGLGPLDLDGESRSQGSSPDIGADELTVAAPPQTPIAAAPTPPSTTSTAKKCKKGYKLKTVKTKKGKKKKCVKKKRRR